MSERVFTRLERRVLDYAGPVNFPVWLTVGAWKIHPHLFFELLGYAVGAVRNIFRVLIMQFIDQHAFDVRRDHLEKERLDPLRREALLA